MGTSLHAIVEVLQPEVPEYSIRESWTDLCTWDLGKCYTLMLALREAIDSSWPNEPSQQAQRLRDRGTADSGHMWCSREFLPEVADLEGWELDAYASLRACCAAFQRPVRVLFFTL